MWKYDNGSNIGRFLYSRWIAYGTHSSKESRYGKLTVTLVLILHASCSKGAGKQSKGFCEKNCIDPSTVTVTKTSPIPGSSMPSCTPSPTPGPPKDCFSDYEWKTWGETDNCVECKNGKCFNNIKIDNCFSPASSITWTPEGRPDPSIPVKKTCMVQWGENTMCSSLDEYDKCNNTQFVSYCKDKKGNILGTNRYSCKAQALMGPTCVPVKPN